MKLIYLIFLTTISLPVIGQYSPIVNFPVSTFEYTGDPLVDQSGDTVTFELKVYHSIPENPKGVIYFFHGGGGSGLIWLLLVEQPFLLNEAIDRGYGIITMDSNNRNGNRWDVGMDTNGNIVGQNDSYDTEHVWMVHQNMLDNGKYDEDTPLFAVGFSNGGAFTSRLGLRASSYFIDNEPDLPHVNHLVPFSAVAIYGALGSYAKAAEYNVPTIFNVGINDNKVPPYPNMTWHPDWPYAPGNTVVFTHQKLIASGVETEFNVKPEETVNPFMFALVPGIDSSGSSVIYDSLKAIAHPITGMPFISADDSLLVHPGTNNFWKNFVPQMYQNKLPQIEQQLNVKYAGHVVFREFRDETLDFFDGQLMSTSINDNVGAPESILNVKCYPNPFVDDLNISYNIAKSCYLDILIYDNVGRLVHAQTNQFHNAGSYNLSWQPKNRSGSVLNGIYHATFRAENDIVNLRFIKL